MKTIIAIYVFLTLIASCNRKDMTLKELEKAKWDSLAVGVGFISMENEKGIVSGTDSIAFTLKGVSGKELNPTDLLLVDITGDINSLLTNLLKTEGTDSKSGYLRINLYEILMNSLTVMVYLSGDSDDTTHYNFRDDSINLKNISRIRDVKFISKEAAKKKYLDDGNNTWEHVLKENPLPSSFELTLDRRKWTEEELKDIKRLVMNSIARAFDVSYPTIMFKTTDQYYFFQYERLKK